jgi:hypothetical protein
LDGRRLDRLAWCGSSAGCRVDVPCEAVRRHLQERTRREDEDLAGGGPRARRAGLRGRASRRERPATRWTGGWRSRGFGEGGRVENGFVTYDEGERLCYFAERHGKGERLSLLKVSSTQAGLLGEENNVGIVYVLTRDAEDLYPELGGPVRIAFGKGAIKCEIRQIFAWSMEMRAGEERTLREAAGWLCKIHPAGGQAKPWSHALEFSRLQASGVRYSMGDLSSDEETTGFPEACNLMPTA